MGSQSPLGKDWAKILDLIPQIIGYVGSDLRYWAANRQFEKWMGFRRGEMIGRDVQEIVTQKFGADVFNFIAPKLLRALGGEVVSYERETHDGGQRRTILVEYTPDYDEHGNVRGVVMVISDLTARKRAEERMRASEEIFRGLSASNPAGIFQADVEGNVTYVNPRLTQDWQLSAKECMGRGWTRRVHHDDLETLLRTWCEATAQGREFDMVYRIVLDTQEIRWMHGRSSPVYGTNAQPLGSVGTVYDITAERRARVRSRQSEDRFRKIFEDAPVAMAISDPASMEIIAANGEAARFFGYTVEELRGMNIAELSHPDDMQLDREHAAQIHSGETSGYTMEKRFRNRQGQELRGLLTVSAVRGDLGNDRLLLGTVVDLTQQRRLETQVRQKLKMEAIGQLAGGIAHDFNNLLMIINSYAEQILTARDVDLQVAKKAHAIEEAGTRAAQLTQQLLAFSRQQHLQPLVLDVNELVRKAENMLSRLVREDITLTTELSSDPLKVKADPSQLEQVLMNLVINARDALPQGGRIQIVSSRTELNAEEAARLSFLIPPGPYVEMRVIDDGIGMSPEVANLIFEPFFTTKAAGHGTGLGLSTAYGIVKQSGGWIFCDSVPGQGSTFRILLPLVDSELSSPQRTAKTVKADPAMGNILLVEDEPAVRQVLAETLGRRGYHVLQASNGEEALEISGRQNDIDMLITDTVMPRMGGRRLALALWQRIPNLKVIFMSGYIESSEGGGELENRNHRFLQKPFSQTDFLNLVQDMLDHE